MNKIVFFLRKFTYFHQYIQKLSTERKKKLQRTKDFEKNSIKTEFMHNFSIENVYVFCNKFL